MSVTVLFVPGLRDHVADHWQTHAALALPGSITVEPLQHDRLSLTARIDALDAAVHAIEGEVVLAAHSAGCLMVAAWAMHPTRAIKGALLGGRISLDGPNNRWILALFARNLLDKAYRPLSVYQPLGGALGLSNTVFPGSTASRVQAGEPRAFGASAAFRF